MTWPSDLTTVVVDGKYENFDGTPASGRVIFTPSLSVVDVSNATRLVPTAFIAVLNSGTGTFSVELPATDDPDVTPTNFTYNVSEQIVGYAPSNYNISVPAASPVGGDSKRHMSLVLASPVVVNPSQSSYLLTTNNLSDLSNQNTARINLGLGSAALSQSYDFDPAGAAGTVYAALSAQLNASIPGQWTPTDHYVAGTHRSYGGQEWVAASDVPTGIAPTPIGNGSVVDRQILLAGRCGYASAVVGGDAYPTLTVTNQNSSGAGSFTQALADSKAAGGGYIVWSPGTYTHAYSAGTAALIPSNTTVNGWAADVTFAGFGQDDNTTFSVGGLSNTDFTGYYNSVPVHDVIVTGIKFQSNNGVADSHGDVVSVRYWAKNIWFDHCYLTNPQKLTDGLFDITHCDSATVSWCDFYKHHKAVLTHSKPIVSSPSGTQLPPGITAGSPGGYTIQNVGGVDYIQNRVTYVHDLFDSLAQRGPESDFDTTYVDVAGCWSRLFGGYNDGVNATVNGLYDWPTITGSRWSETTLPGPSLGPDGLGISVPGAYRRNSGSGSKANGTSVSVTGSHMLVRNSIYTNLVGDTNQPIGGSGGNWRSDTNLYENAPYSGDVHPERVSSPSYPLNLVAQGDLKNALRYGTGTNAKGYWTYVGVSTLGTVGTVVQQAGISVGAAKILNFAGSGFDTLSFDAPSGTVTVHSTSGAADPTTFLRYDTFANIPTAGVGFKNDYFFASDRGIIYQCQGTGPYNWIQVTGGITPAVVAGQEIGTIAYHPSGSNGTNATTTSTSLVDYAGLAVTAAWTSNSASMFDLVFVAPASGNVRVKMSSMQSISAAVATDWALYDVTAAAVVTNSELQVVNSASQLRPVYDKKFTGLTPGTTYTWRWQVKLQSAGTLTFYSGGTKGNVSMVAYAA